MNLFFILGSVGLAGCLIAIILTLLFHAMGRSKIIPLLVYLLSFALFIGGGFLYAHPDAVPVLGGSDEQQADAPAEPDKAGDEDGQAGGGEEQTGGEESQTGDEDRPQDEAAASGEGYAVTYTNAEIFTDSIGTIWCQVIAEIENTGDTDLYLSSVSYDLEDGNGKLIASKSLVPAYPQVISPGEKAYMYEETTLDNEVSGKATVIPRPSAAPASVANIRFITTDVELSSDRYGSLKALGRVENNTGEDSELTYVVVILKNGEGTPIGQMSTIINGLAAGEKVGFQASAFSLPEDITLDDVAGYDVYAYPLQMQF